MLGECIADRYELEELVGRGGMSSVFRAHDTLLERNVALKVLHEHYGEDADQIERFRREARAVAQLSHPNIVTVIDRGERDGRQYIVFEFVEGENLKQLVLREGPLPVRQAVEIGLQVAEALAFAHRQGLVHRDVKPQNILLTRDGEAKVTDFGIARAVDVHGLTQTGSVVGTSHYIAPEQASGRAVDSQSDVYSLGTVLYELLTGDVPFQGENFIAVALKHVSEPAPSAAARRGDVPPRLDGALRRAMAKEPSERFDSMEAFADELERCLAELGPDSPNEATMVVPAPAATPAPAAPPEALPELVSTPAAGRGRRRLWVPLVLAGLVAAGVVTALFALGTIDLRRGSGSAGTRSTGETTTSANLQPVPLRAVATDDPANDGEHDVDVPKATDGDPNTFWSTEGYDADLPEIGKAGVGIVLAAGARRVAEVRVTSDTPGFTARIQAGANDHGPFHDVSKPAIVGSAHTFALDGTAHPRYLVIWITKLAHPDKYRAHVNEVTARG